MLEFLPRVVPESPGKPEDSNLAHPMRKVTRDIAVDEHMWSDEVCENVKSLFNQLAPTWSQRTHSMKFEPLEDAFERGLKSIDQDMICLEVASGTGLVTPLLKKRFKTVVSFDISKEMLINAPKDGSTKLLADSARIPIKSKTIDVAVLVNAFLFPKELCRTLKKNGYVVFISTLSDRTPIYLPPQEVFDLLPGDWEGYSSEADWGCWTALRQK